MFDVLSIYESLFQKRTCRSEKMPHNQQQIKDSKQVMQKIAILQHVCEQKRQVGTVRTRRYGGWWTLVECTTFTESVSSLKTTKALVIQVAYISNFSCTVNSHVKLCKSDKCNIILEYNISSYVDMFILWLFNVMVSVIMLVR